MDYAFSGLILPQLATNIGITTLVVGSACNFCTSSVVPVLSQVLSLGAARPVCV